MKEFDKHIKIETMKTLTERMVENGMDTELLKPKRRRIRKEKKYELVTSGPR
jgi:hypothetical protein